jgi:hypothetical protein
VFGHLRVEARNVTVVDNDIVLGITTYGKTFFEDVEDKFISVVENKSQIGHVVATAA